MEGEGTSEATKAVVETLTTRGWCLGDINQVKALIIIHSALSDDDDISTVAASVESELLNMDLRSIGAKSLPDPNLLHKSSNLQGPKVLQIASVRDISASSMEDLSDSRNRRLLRLILTDGHNQITAIEYNHIPSIPNDVTPGTKVRLENRVPIYSGIVCLNPKVITLMGGVVQSLYEEWQMNRKYSGLLHSSLRISQETDSGGPPPFEKLQIGAPFRRSSQRAVASYGAKPDNFGMSTKGVAESLPVPDEANAPKLLQQISHPSKADKHSRDQTYKGKGKQQEPQVLTLDKEIDYSDSTSKSIMPSAADPAGNAEITPVDKQQKADNIDDKVKTTSLGPIIEQKPSNSEMRLKEVTESIPVQNQAAAQKLLEKMSHPNQSDQRSRGRKHRGKGKQEEQQLLTLDEWEKRNMGARPPTNNEASDTSRDEDVAWQLQNQLDVEDSRIHRGMQNTVADDIRMSMFNYQRDADRAQGMEHGVRGRGKGKGRWRGRGKGRGRG